MRSKRNRRGILVLTTCVSLALVSTGCRSGKSNLFSFRSEPSPEALAGDGPTTTYPVPPSESATPEAIASVAGGTGSPNSPITPSIPKSPAAQVASLNTTPSYVSPATNMSAAQANGFHGATTKPAGFQTPSANPPPISPGTMVPDVKAPQTTTSGYQFGTNPAAKASGGSSYNIPSSYTTPSTELSAAAPAVPAVANAGGGFTLPTNLAPTVTTAGGSADACADCDGCEACKGASAAPPVITATAPNETYSPGSTGSASGYPTMLR